MTSQPATPERWCCDAIRQCFERRAERGFFVFAEPPGRVSPDPSFWLTFRAVDRSAMGIPVAPPELQRVPVTLQTWLPVRFCPWCGREFGTFYAKTWQQLVDEAELAAHRVPS